MPTDRDDPAYCYTPSPGGLKVWYSDGPGVQRPAPGSCLGAVEDDPRLHRRPLFPPADKRLLWDAEDVARIRRCAFRPIVLAYLAPRFVLDMHTAGGLCGHLFLGLANDSRSKWFHDWADIEADYRYGWISYTVRDPSFPGVKVEVSAAPLANSVGMFVRCEVSVTEGCYDFVWMYGGASAHFTSYDFGGPEFAFAPEHCAKDQLRLTGDAFTLRRAFEQSDAYLQSSEAINRYLTDWEVDIQGRCDAKGDLGLGDPRVVLESPGPLLASVDWSDGPTQARGKVVVGRVPADPDSGSVTLVIGTGGDIEQAMGDMAAQWRAALARAAQIGDRVVIRTPDPYLDATATMMGLLNEATWGDCSILHGAWSWRNPYLGWRGWYGPTLYGWQNRVRDSIVNHITLNLVRDGPDRGALGSILYEPTGVYYNMNEVFTDHVRHYLDYTDDRELMEQVFPVLEGVLEWEDRRLRPGPELLYENALNTWISDSHWYIRGQCTQASAYMLGAWGHLARLAERLGRDPAPYAKRATQIREAMQSALWLKREGVFAEYRDTLGHGLLHPEPELPTIYHAAEFGACDHLQVYQMLHWADTRLRIENGAGGALQYWSSNWFPNRARSYTHSTYEMAYAEQFNLALTNYLVGREDVAYALVRSSFCGVFNGLTPGGLTCHSYADGRQRFNDEFADAVSMWARMVIEGTFGIVVKRPEGRVELTPQPPRDWPQASIHTPHFSYQLARGQGIVSIEWESPVETAVHVRLPLRATAIRQVTVDGFPAEYGLEAGFGLTWLTVTVPAAVGGMVAVSYDPAPELQPPTLVVREGDGFSLALGGIGHSAWEDPQELFTDLRITDGVLRGTVAGAPGPGVFFLRDEAAACPRWTPVSVTIEPARPAAPRVWRAPQVQDGSRWTPVDISAVYNASSPMEVLEKVTRASVPPGLPASHIGFGYRNSHYTGNYLTDGFKPDDSAWRAKVGPDGIAWTTDGIPFRTSKQGPNVGIVTLVAAYPEKLAFAVGEAGEALYLMLTGITFPNQSHVPNLRVTLRYGDGSAEEKDLVNPFDIGDCWATSTGRCHDTAANGFENLGGRRGPAGSIEVADLTVPVEGDTEAHLIRFDLREGQALESVEIEAICNDAVYGVMGATVLKTTP